MRFGKNFKEARIASGLTQKQLATLIGVKHNTISDWENERTAPNTDQISRLCMTLGIGADALFGTGDVTSSISPAGMHIGRLYDRADDRAREIVELTLKPFDDGSMKKGSYTRDRSEAAVELAPYINHIMKPIVGVAAAGNPDPVVDMEPEMIIADDSPSSADVGYRLNGRSMEPRYSHMSIVWVDSDADVDIGQIGVFIVDGEITCKRLQEDENGPYLEPLNKEYGIIRINEDTDCRSKGRVVS